MHGSRSVLWNGIDAGLIDGIVNGIGKRARHRGRRCCGCCNRETSAATRPGCCWVRSSSSLIMGFAEASDEPLDILLALPPGIGFLLLLLLPARDNANAK